MALKSRSTAMMRDDTAVVFGEDGEGPPLPWDEDGQFRKGRDVECFMETGEGGLVKVGKKLKFGVIWDDG